MALIQTSGLVFRYSLDWQTSSHECQSDTIQVKAIHLRLHILWSCSLITQIAVNHNVQNQCWESSYKEQISWPYSYSRCQKHHSIIAARRGQNKSHFFLKGMIKIVSLKLVRLNSSWSYPVASFFSVLNAQLGWIPTLS